MAGNTVKTVQKKQFMKHTDDALILSCCESVHTFLAAHADAGNIKKYSRYFREGYDAWGVDDKAMRAQRDLWYSQWKLQLNRQQMLALGDRLMAAGKYEESIIAINLLIQLQKDDKSDILSRAGEWLEKFVVNWAQTDYMAGDAISPILLADPAAVDELLPWRKSASKWRRRAVPVSLIKLMKQRGEPEKMLLIIDPMMNDAAREVQQGLGWFLREVWKKHPDAAEPFLLKWKDTCGRLIIQYATERMDASQKILYKKSVGQKGSTIKKNK